MVVVPLRPFSIYGTGQGNFPQHAKVCLRHPVLTIMQGGSDYHIAGYLLRPFVTQLPCPFHFRFFSRAIAIITILVIILATKP